MNLRVAAIMPVYNKAPFLEESIRSVLNQSFTEFDLIILDDCSTDDSVKIIESFKDERIKLFKAEKNGGTSKSGNFLFEKSRNYDYAIRCDADDIFHTDRFKKLVEKMENDKRIGICSSQLKKFGNMSDSIKLPLHNLEIKARLFFTAGISQPAAIFRMTEINKLKTPIYKNFDSNIGEDWMLFAELSKKMIFSNHEESLVDYRVHENNISGNNSDFFQTRKTAVEFVSKTFYIPNHLSNAYFTLMGKMFESNTKRSKLEIVVLIKIIRQRFSILFGDESIIDAELKIRFRKTVCMLADKNLIQALLLLYQFPEFSDLKTLKYCFTKIIPKR